MSDSRDSNVSNSGSSSAGEQESARKKQALEPAIAVASRAAEIWPLLGGKGGCFRCPEWMKLVELVLVMSALKSPQRSSLKEKHTNVCAGGFKSMEYDLVSLPVIPSMTWFKREGTAQSSIDQGKMVVTCSCCEACGLVAGLVGGQSIKIALLKKGFPSQC
eukprot:1154603-Pelagomonas_calceolata.AAC.4